MLYKGKDKKKIEHASIPASYINHPTLSTNDQSLFNDFLNTAGEEQLQPSIMDFCKYFL